MSDPSQILTLYFRDLFKIYNISNFKVIITNKDLALANAIINTFSKAARLLYKFHIKRNVIFYIRKLLKRIDFIIDRNIVNEDEDNETITFKAMIK